MINETGSSNDAALKAKGDSNSASEPTGEQRVKTVIQPRSLLIIRLLSVFWTAATLAIITHYIAKLLQARVSTIQNYAAVALEFAQTFLLEGIPVSCRIGGPPLLNMTCEIWAGINQIWTSSIHSSIKWVLVTIKTANPLSGYAAFRLVQGKCGVWMPSIRSCLLKPIHIIHDYAAWTETTLQEQYAVWTLMNSAA
jgi:hypothetical protein